MKLLYSYKQIDSIFVHNMRNSSYYVKQGMNHNEIEQSLARFYHSLQIPFCYDYDKLEILKIECNHCKINTSFIIDDRSIIEGENITTSRVQSISNCYIVPKEMSTIIINELSFNNYICYSEFSDKLKLCYFICSNCGTPHLLIYNTQEKEVNSNRYIYKREIIGLHIIDSLTQQTLQSKTKDIYCNALNTLSQEVKQSNNYLSSKIYLNMQYANQLDCNESLLYYVDWNKTDFHIWGIEKSDVTIIEVTDNFVYYRIEDKLFFLPRITNKSKRRCLTQNYSFIEIYKDIYLYNVEKKSYCIEQSQRVLNLNNIDDYLKYINLKDKIVLKYFKLFLYCKYSFISFCKNIKYEIITYLKYGINPRKIYVTDKNRVES